MNHDKVNIFIPSEDHIISLFQTRKIDIQTRGKDCYVFDKNNEIVTLEKCSIWYDSNGNYVYPKATEQLECNLM